MSDTLTPGAETLTGRQRNAVGPVIGISLRAGDELCPNGVADLLTHAEAAERWGFFDFDCPDHVLLSPDNGNYPAGGWRWELDSAWPDPFVVLAAVAARTSRIHLTTSILVAPLRPAAVIAKAAATLDNLSAGRLRLGVGAGWLQSEFDSAGVPFTGRTARMEDTIGACRALWTRTPATFDSPTVSFADAWCFPKPARPSGIPVLVAGPPTARLAARVAKLAEGWNPMDAHRDGLADGVKLLHQAFEAAGRDPATAVIRTPAAESVVQQSYRTNDPALLRSEIESLREIGITDVKIYISKVAETADEVDRVLGWLADACGIETEGEA